jgi:FMN reductase
VDAFGGVRRSGGLSGLERRTPAGVGPGQPGRRRPVIVGLGGSSRPDSATQRALNAVMRMASQAGAETVVLGPAELDLPPYPPDRRVERVPAARRLISEINRADGLVLASPDYHGGVSGLLKNALDYLHDLNDLPRPCLEARAVGLVVCSERPDTAGGTLTALRSIVHALGGWPTPLGITLNSLDAAAIDAFGNLSDPVMAERFGTLTDQIMGFAYAWSHLI